LEINKRINQGEEFKSYKKTQISKQKITADRRLQLNGSSLFRLETSYNGADTAGNSYIDIIYIRFYN